MKRGPCGRTGLHSGGVGRPMVLAVHWLPLAGHGVSVGFCADRTCGHTLERVAGVVRLLMIACGRTGRGGGAWGGGHLKVIATPRVDQFEICVFRHTFSGGGLQFEPQKVFRRVLRPLLVGLPGRCWPNSFQEAGGWGLASRDPVWGLHTKLSPCPQQVAPLGSIGAMVLLAPRDPPSPPPPPDPQLDPPPTPPPPPRVLTDSWGGGRIRTVAPPWPRVLPFLLGAQAEAGGIEPDRKGQTYCTFMPRAPLCDRELVGGSGTGADTPTVIRPPCWSDHPKDCREDNPLECGQGFFRIIKNQGGGDPSPKTPSPPPQTKVTIVGKNEIYNRENLVRPFLVHQVLGPKPPPPLPPPAQKKP